VGAGPKDMILGYLAGYEGAKPPKDYKPGPVYPKQFLMVGFIFDSRGRLTSVAAQGPALGDEGANNALREWAFEHPESRDEKVAVELKRRGAKYSPADKQAFTGNLPVQVLQRFLGKLDIVSVEFYGLDGATILPMWIVKAKTESSRADHLMYELWFEPFKGDLISIKTIELPRVGPAPQAAP
jgi:hypothetical protein